MRNTQTSSEGLNGMLDIRKNARAVSSHVHSGHPCLLVLPRNCLRRVSLCHAASNSRLCRSLGLHFPSKEPGRQIDNLSVEATSPAFDTCSAEARIPFRSTGMFCFLFG